jgi:hypothetical protein
MKMVRIQKEQAIRSENPVAVLELTDTDLTKVLGGTPARDEWQCDNYGDNNDDNGNTYSNHFDLLNNFLNNLL